MNIPENEIYIYGNIRSGFTIVILDAIEIIEFE